MQNYKPPYQTHHIYSGKTAAAVIKSTEYDIITGWEIKSQLIVLQGGGEIAQTVAEMAGELEAMFDNFDFKPPRYAAVLTNGMAYLFVHCKYSYLGTLLFIWSPTPNLLLK
jgi:hypothetical protein